MYLFECKVLMRGAHGVRSIFHVHADSNKEARAVIVADIAAKGQVAKSIRTKKVW